MATEIQIRRDTAANWTSVNPTPAQGEICLETDTGKVKFGTGTTAWVSLPYFAVAQVPGAAPLVSPALTGTPTAPTPTVGDSSTKVATTAFVSTATGAYEALGSARIDLCMLPYNATPGADVTSALQTAINWIAANCPNGGEIFFSTPGTYLLNGAPQTGTALTYSYNGQILFPAVTYTGANIPIRIRGGTPASRGSQWAGTPTGVVLQSNASGAYMFDCVPATSQWGWQWTGITPIFEDIVLQSPAGGTAGGVNALCALHARFERFAVKATGSTIQPTGTLHAIAGPHGENNGFVVYRDVSIFNMPIGIRIAEHHVLDNVAIIDCTSAFEAGENGHLCWFGYVDVEGCPNIFYSPAGRTLTVAGTLDIENTGAGGTWQQPTYLVQPGSASDNIYGALAVNLDIAGSLALGAPCKHLDLSSTSSSGTVVGGEASTAGWKSKHPVDNFSRSGGATLTGYSPGQCSPTLHPWRTVNGTWHVSGGQCHSDTTSTTEALVPCLNGGVNRNVSMTTTLAASGYNVYLEAHRCLNGSHDGNFFQVRLNAGVVGLYVNGVLRKSGGAITGGSTYTVSIDVFYGTAGVPNLVRVWLGSTMLYTYAPTAAEQALLTSNGNIYPFVEDGFRASNDATSYLTLFQVSALGGSPSSLSSGTATLVAGTVTVTDANITASSVIRLNRQTAGGTLGELSVALSAGTSFTINSNNAADTSSVFWEIVSY